MTIMNHTRGLPVSRPDKPKRNPTKTQDAENRQKNQLNCVSYDWHRRAKEMYALRKQERMEYLASKRP